jgi:uracil phosphoribosyltransferase
MPTDAPRVLVVDDEPNIVDVISMALRFQGFEVAAAHTGGDALAQVASFRPHLLLLDVMLPDARIGHLGMQRDERTHSPHGYFERLPPHLAETHVFVLDPMLATGGSALYALDRLREAGARHVRLICLVSAPEGVAAVHERHPGVPIWTAALDRGLDSNAFIRPGLGDAGDRVFGTPPE